MNLRRTLLSRLLKKDHIPWWASRCLELDPQWVNILNTLMRSHRPSSGPVDRERFWPVYHTLPMEMQPIALAWFDRRGGLQTGDAFYKNPATQRMWLHSDPQTWGIPCALLWSWLEKACPSELESCYLLAGYEHATLTDVLAKEVSTLQTTYMSSPNGMGELKEAHGSISMADVDAIKVKEAYFHWSLLFAMVFRMSFSEYHSDWEQEETTWVAYYASWPENIRINILKVLCATPLERTRGFMHRHLRTWFPDSSHVIDAAESLGENPARAVLAWTQEKWKCPTEMPLAGIL